jgi:Tol biopolymer transport system component
MAASKRRCKAAPPPVKAVCPQSNRVGSMSFCRRLLAVFLPLALCACGGGHGDYFAPRYGIQDLALSPDGSTVAVRFTDRELKKSGLGLYEWERGRFTPIRNPASDRSFSDPSFSPDGTRLVAVSGNQIVVIDLATLGITQVTEGGQGFKESPTFLPDGSGILYVLSNPARFMLVNLADRQEKQMLDPLVGFGTISRPCFGGPDRIIFTASAPRNPELYAELEKFPGSRPDRDVHVYGMKFGEQPQLILNNLWLEGKKRSRWFAGEGSLQASKDARRIVFIDYAESSAGPDNNVDQELFVIDDGALRQLTHLNASLMAAAISYDGGTVAVGCDSGRSMSHDLCVIDMNSGKLRKVGLLRDLHLAPD